MNYATLGRTGIRVSRIAFGTVRFTRLADEIEYRRILDHAVDQGINLIDTADRYGPRLATDGIGGGEVEELLGRWLDGKRHHVVLATKVGGRTGVGPNDAGLSPVHLAQAVEASLHRLRTDYIDLYQMHAVDELTPIETTLRVLDNLVRQGKIRAIGCSNWAAWELCDALWTSDVRNLVRFESVQPRYNLLAREIEAELLPLCAAKGVGVLAYSPIASGVLSGKYRWEQQPADPNERRQKFVRAQYGYQPTQEAVARLQSLASRSGRSLAQYAIAWVLHHPVVTAALIGASSMDQLRENLTVLDRPLGEDEYRAGCEASAGAVSAPSPGPRQTVGAPLTGADR